MTCDLPWPHDTTEAEAEAAPLGKGGPGALGAGGSRGRVGLSPILDNPKEGRGNGEGGGNPNAASLESQSANQLLPRGGKQQQHRRTIGSGAVVNPLHPLHQDANSPPSFNRAPSPLGGHGKAVQASP